MCQSVSDQENVSQSQKTKLAVAMAQGMSVTAWAHKNNVPRRTAFRWASEPNIRMSVESSRRRALDRAVGRPTSRGSRGEGLVRALVRDWHRKPCEKLPKSATRFLT